MQPAAEQPAEPDGSQTRNAGAEAAPPGQSFAEEAAAAPRRTKKGRKGRRGNGGGRVAAMQTAQTDLAAIVPLPQGSEVLQMGWRPVMLSKFDKAPQLVVSENRLGVTGHKGYRMARATHGAHEGTWYFEITVQHLGPTGHARLGWATRFAELQAPVGFDKHSFGYRDLEGSKVYQALREEYGQPFREGDVVGCLLHMPPGGRALQHSQQDVRTYKGGLYILEGVEPDPPPAPLPGSFIAFSLNGASQGVAYRDLTEGTYFPAASVYTMPEQTEGASVEFNFGPDFRHSPPEEDGCPAARPVCELAGSPDDDAGAAAAQAAKALEAKPAAAATGSVKC